MLFTPFVYRWSGDHCYGIKNRHIVASVTVTIVRPMLGFWVSWGGEIGVHLWLVFVAFNVSLCPDPRLSTEEI